MEIVSKNNNEISETGDVNKPSVCALEILVHGEEKDKDLLFDKLLSKIQMQLDNSKNGIYARILWYLADGKSDEERIKWLYGNSSSYYQIVLDKNYDLKDSFIDECFEKINNLIEAKNALVTFGLTNKK